MTQNEQKAQSASAAQTSATAARSRARHKGVPPRAQTEAVIEALFDEKFDAMRCALCHDSRERFFATLHRFVMFFSALSGAASVASLLKEAPQGWTIFFGATVTVLTTLDLVLDLSGSARRHATLKEHFYNILADCYADTMGDAKPYRAQLTKLYGIEPPLPNTLDHMMWNKTYQFLSQDPKEEHLYVIGFWRALTRHLLSHERKRFQTKGEKNGC